MRKLDIGIHAALPSQPLYLESSDCLVSNTVAVSRLAQFPASHLSNQTRADMSDSVVGDVAVMGVPPEAQTLCERFVQHVGQVYGLGDRGVIADDDLQAQLVWCNGAAYHEDACFNCVLAVMLWSGPSRDLVLPHLNAYVAMEPGTVVLFDSSQPHGLLHRGERVFDKARYPAGSELSVFCGLDLPRDLRGLRALMAFEPEPLQVPAAAFRLREGTGVDSRTGAWLPERYLASLPRP